MIYYALSHKDGAQTLATKYHLPYVPPEDYIKESALTPYLDTLDHDLLLHAIQIHKKVHAYVLSGLSMYFHPVPITKIVSTSFERYFISLLKTEGA